MIKELIELTEKKVIFRTLSPIDTGAEIELEIELPEGLAIKSFVLKGMINTCVKVQPDSYHVEMAIIDLHSVTQKILIAYIEFLNRGRILNDARIDKHQLQHVLMDLKMKFSRLARTVELLKKQAEGTLEMLKRDSSGKTTLH